jgi:hypothetical protein
LDRLLHAVQASHAHILVALVVVGGSDAPGVFHVMRFVQCGAVAAAAVGSFGTSKVTRTRREPHFGHFIRLATVREKYTRKKFAILLLAKPRTLDVEESEARDAARQRELANGELGAIGLPAAPPH